MNKTILMAATLALLSAPAFAQSNAPVGNASSGTAEGRRPTAAGTYGATGPAVGNASSGTAEGRRPTVAGTYGVSAKKAKKRSRNR